MDDDEDAFLIAASQQIEDQFSQAGTINTHIDYESFATSAPGTSTQNVAAKVRNETRTGFTEQIRNELFIDLTVNTDDPLHKQALPARHLQSIPNPVGGNYPQSQALRSSQKENGISAQQLVTVQANKIKALTIQLKNKDEANAKLQDTLVEKNGETTNLRRDKKMLEDQIKTMKLQKVHEAGMIKDDQEKVRLRNEVEKLRTQLKFVEISGAPRTSPTNKSISESKPATKISFITNFPLQPSIRAPEVPSSIFDNQCVVSMMSESVNTARERSSQEDVVQMQLRLAQVHSTILTGGRISERLIETLFTDASVTILRIYDYICYLQMDDEEPVITFDTNMALTACLAVSVPMLREKLTVCNEAQYQLSKDEGRLSVFQAGKLYPEEQCEKPRRIIACYATIAKYSRLFSEMLLTNVITENQTFVSILVGAIEKIVESDSVDVNDYFGLAIASSSLLASLASHYDNYDDTKDDSLYRFLVAVLSCRCDNAILMAHVADLLVSVSKNQSKTGLIQRLCTNFPPAKVIYSKMFKMWQYPPEGCTFQLIFIFLKNAFNFDAQANHYELDLLLQTTHNLNQTALNIQNMPIGTLKFLDREEGSQEVCGCFENLLSAVLMLNHLALSYRNIDQKLVVPKPNIRVEDDAMDGKKKIFHYHSSKLN